jgi:hypothetical protein
VLISSSFILSSYIGKRLLASSVSPSHLCRLLQLQSYRFCCCSLGIIVAPIEVVSGVWLLKNRRGGPGL